MCGNKLKWWKTHVYDLDARRPLVSWLHSATYLTAEEVDALVWEPDSRCVSYPASRLRLVSGGDGSTGERSRCRAGPSGPAPTSELEADADLDLARVVRASRLAEAR